MALLLLVGHLHALRHPAHPGVPDHQRRARDREVRDDRATLYTSFRRYVEGNPVYVPFASSFATHHGGVHIFDRMPATRIAIDWLWEDLKELKFLNGSPPNRL